MEAEARKKLTVAAIADVCRNGYLAIVPVVVKNGRGHYLMVAKDNRRAEPVVINPLPSVRPLSDELADMLLPHGGVALFVGGAQNRAKTDVGGAPEIRFDPAEVDLGNIEVDGPKSLTPLERTLSLTNKSDRPVLVTGIVGTCGCTEPGWTKGIIDANGSREIPVMISKLRWGTGPQQRRLVAAISDGSSAEMQMNGVGVNASHQPGIQVVPDSISFEMNDAFLATGTVELPRRSLLVSVAPEQRSKLHVKASVPWINASLSEIDNQHGQVEVCVTVDDDLRRRLRDLFHTEEGDVVISDGPEGIAVSTRVSLRRKPMFSFSSKSAVFSKSATEIEVSVIPSDKNGPKQFEFGKLGCVPKGLELQTVQSTESPRRLRIRRLPETTARSYLIRAELICEQGRDIIHSTVVIE